MIYMYCLTSCRATYKLAWAPASKHTPKNKLRYNAKTSAHYPHAKAKALENFNICISAPPRPTIVNPARQSQLPLT